MRKKVTSIRASDETVRRLKELQEHFNTSAGEIVTIAIDRLYQKMEAKMKTKGTLLSQEHYDIIDWVGESGDFPADLTDQQAKDTLRWLEENDISVERSEDIEKLRDYCENL